MKAKHLLLSSALVIPALLLPLASCEDSKVPTEPAAGSDTPDEIDGPSFTTVGFGSFWHDPHIKGPKVRTFTSSIGLGCTENSGDARAKRFKSQDGAELSTIPPGFFEDDGVTATTIIYGTEDACLAGAYPATNKIKGKLLTAVRELDFSYAGGRPRGAPVMRIPIDECLPPDITPGVIVTPPCSTDGTMEAYAYISAGNSNNFVECNDGDPFVGTVNGQDKEVCPIHYKELVWDNWQDFANDPSHTGWKVARKKFDPAQLPDQILVEARTEVFISPVLDQNSHYLVWMIDVR